MLRSLTNKFLAALGARRAPGLELWQSQAEAMVRESVAAAKKEVDDERKELAQIYEAFLQGDPAAWLEKWTKESNEHWNSRVKFAVDFCSSFLDVLSTLYGIDSGPERRFVDAPRIHWRHAAWWSDWAKRNQLDLFMRDVDRWTRFHGAGVIEARFVPGDRLNPRPWVRLIYHRVYHLDVVQDPTQPDRAVAMRIFAGKDTQTSGTPQMLYHYWTDDMLALCEDWVPVDGAVIPNLYGTIPCIRVVNQLDADQYWVDGIGAKMVPFNLEFNRLLTGLGDSVEHMDGQPVYKGPEAPPYVGLDTQVHLPNKDDDYWMEKPGSDIAAKILGLQELLDYWSISIGLPAGFLRAKLQQTRESPSGVAIIATQLGLSQDRELREKLFRSVEEQIVEMVGHVWLRHTGQDIRTRDFGIAYPSVSRSLLSVSDRRENWRFELDAGLVPRWMVLREMRPGLSEGAARLIVAEADRDKEGSDARGTEERWRDQARDEGRQQARDEGRQREDRAGGAPGSARRGEG
jgi:hypothetical protein